MPTPKIQVDDNAPIDGSEVIKLVSGDGVTLVQTADDEKALITVNGTPSEFTASELAVEDAGGFLAATDVEAALAELGAEKVQFERLTFTETAAAGVYTGTLVVPDGAVVLFVAWRTTAAWAADTTTMDVGITGALTTWGNDINVDAAAGDTLIPDPTDTAPTILTTEDVIAEITTTGAGGTTGRTSVFVGYAVPAATAATKVAS